MARALIVTLLLASCTHGVAAPRPAERFACGSSSCDARTSYCELVQTDVPALPSTYTCRALPAACSACDCFPREARCGMCAPLERGGVRFVQRTCVGGF